MVEISSAVTVLPPLTWFGFGSISVFHSNAQISIISIPQRDQKHSHCHHQLPHTIWLRQIDGPWAISIAYWKIALISLLCDMKHYESIAVSHLVCHQDAVNIAVKHLLSLRHSFGRFRRKAIKRGDASIPVRILSPCQNEQGYHHTGDQAARRPHMMCSFCGRRFATHRLGVRMGSGIGPSDSPPMDSC